MDPKPTLDVLNLRCPKAITVKREMRLAAKIVYTPLEKKELARVMRTFRARQTRRLGERDTDPSPYDPGHLFYCLDMARAQ